MSRIGIRIDGYDKNAGDDNDDDGDKNDYDDIDNNDDDNDHDDVLCLPGECISTVICCIIEFAFGCLNKLTRFRAAFEIYVYKLRPIGEYLVQMGL